MAQLDSEVDLAPFKLLALKIAVLPGKYYMSVSFTDWCFHCKKNSSVGGLLFHLEEGLIFGAKVPSIKSSRSDLLEDEKILKS